MTGWSGRYSYLLRAGRSGDRIPVGGARNSARVRPGPGAHPTSYTKGTGSFPKVKPLGCGVNRPHPSGAEVNKTVELYLYSPSTSSRQVIL